MSRTLILIIEFLLVTGICFALGIYLAYHFDKKKKARRANVQPHSLPMSAFSVLDHPAARKSPGDASPLDEAEVFAIYGKKLKAMEVLNAALARKRITQDEYDAFKATHNIE
jgi:hypothetical protein